MDQVVLESLYNAELLLNLVEFKLKLMPPPFCSLLQQIPIQCARERLQVMTSIDQNDTRSAYCPHPQLQELLSMVTLMLHWTTRIMEA